MSEEDPDVCSDPNKHGPHPWGWRAGRSIPCPGRKVPLPRDEKFDNRTSIQTRRRDRDRWVQEVTGVVVDSWGSSVKHRHLYALDEDGGSPLCVYPACGVRYREDEAAEAVSGL